MKRSLWLLSLAFGLGLAASCGDSGGDGADGTDEAEGECVVGSAGCPCTPGGGCDPGLECWMDLCIPEGTGGETTTGDGDTTTGDGDTTTTGDTTTGDGDTTTGDGDTTTTTGDGDTTTTGDGDTTTGDGDDTTTTTGGGTPDEVVEVSSGRFHTCARMGDGAVRCWGQGSNGATGYASTDSIGDNEPASAAGEVDIGGDAIDIDAGYTHTCAVLEGGDVVCWGANGSGQLGYGNTDTIGDNETPASAGTVDLGGPAISVGAGNEYTCAVLEGGAVRCWGLGTLGRLGYANTDTIGDDESPASAGDVDVGGNALTFSAGFDHGCAMLEGGGVRCWGRGEDGRLGYANQDNIGDDETPASAGDVDVGGSAQVVSVGAFHSCALLQGGDVRCWGNAGFGKLGYANANDIGDNEAPASAGPVNLGGDAVHLDLGGQHTCAVLQGGGARCWGIGSNGRLGYANTQVVGDNETPADVGDIVVGADVFQISGGYEHTCAVTTMGTVRCWGKGASGRLGYGEITDVGDGENPAVKGDVPLL
ncbi:regulator of chromosome condensation, RCC1 [Plesiocystis pacifica SIR-1]|uniref:Regulator of chromosome condensation, RCC1 n=1 Tax=Plesiocystis pacifica SIR-1 TaxID=391625 RepID=A6FXK1_9BACT|nr:regulator of chromosome condensation RCC1 [Plesiocystis pacifica]EDM81589.1 regulator of chromosome condensation, RCC1 [Plesiocystis pacifica SIR-1]